MGSKKERKKVTTTVYVFEDVLEHVKSNPEIKNFSDWINMRYPEEFMEIDKAMERLQYHSKEAQKWEKHIKLMQNIEKKSTISKEANDWINTDGLERTQTHTTEGVLKFFNNKFNYNLSLRQFKIYLEKARGSK